MDDGRELISVQNDCRESTDLYQTPTKKYLIGEINLRSIAFTLKCIALFNESDRTDIEQGRKRSALSIYKHITFEYDMKGQNL